MTAHITIIILLIKITKKEKFVCKKFAEEGGGDGTAACYDIKETCAID